MDFLTGKISTNSQHGEDNHAITRDDNTILVDSSSQTYGGELNGLVISQHAIEDIENLKSIIYNQLYSFDSFEIILKDHDSVLSMYNRAANLNDKCMEMKEHVALLEENLLKVKQERDSLPLATGLIAQDKYCHRHISQFNSSQSNQV